MFRIFQKVGGVSNLFSLGYLCHTYIEAIEDCKVLSLSKKSSFFSSFSPDYLSKLRRTAAALVNIIITYVLVSM